MGAKMSSESRQELVAAMRARYERAKASEKTKIVDGIVTATGFHRKYVLGLMRKPVIVRVERTDRVRKPKYSQAVRQALMMTWNAANQICAKRLVPFLPEFVVVLERFGHLALPEDVRSGLLSLSVATADRILRTERRNRGRGISTTQPGPLLKKQIPVRTFSDWNETTPGFFEGDLVAHCGDNVEGTFLNTFVLTDIVSGWTEFMAILRRSSSDVIVAFDEVRKIIPFPLLGIDTDNGSEFINYDLYGYCEKQRITFTRSRAYKKNDQAHVEEKNGSIVRRIIGYDRFEGQAALEQLIKLYSVLRLYVNFFQPSQKLISKTREGSHVTKKYDKAKTPYQRVMQIETVQSKDKEHLQQTYELLDPVKLLKELEQLQEGLWKFAWQPAIKTVETESKIPILITEPEPDQAVSLSAQLILQNSAPVEERKQRQYRKSKKPRAPVTWRTHKDPFENVWSELKLKLEINPNHTAKGLLIELIAKHPDRFTLRQCRTLQRRVKAWRKEQARKQYEIYSAAPRTNPTAA
jgi:hypothetical protein